MKGSFLTPSSAGKFLERHSGVTSSRNSCDPFRLVGAPALCSHSLPLSPGCHCHYIHQGGAHNHGVMYSSLSWGRFRAGVCLLCCVVVPWPNSWHLVNHKRRNKSMVKPRCVPAVLRHSSREVFAFCTAPPVFGESHVHAHKHFPNQSLMSPSKSF